MTASPDSRDPPAGGAKLYWLIERGSPAEFWAGTFTSEHWTRDTSKVHPLLKFDRREQAEGEAARIKNWPAVSGSELRIAEHMDMDGPCPKPLKADLHEYAAKSAHCGRCHYWHPTADACKHDPQQCLLCNQVQSGDKIDSDPPAGGDALLPCPFCGSKDQLCVNSYGGLTIIQPRRAALDPQAATIATLRRDAERKDAAIQSAREFISNLRVPQNMKEAALQVFIGSGVLKALDAALADEEPPA